MAPVIPRQLASVIVLLTILSAPNLRGSGCRPQLAAQHSRCQIIAAAECRVNEASVPIPKWMADGAKARRMHVHRLAYCPCLWKRRRALVCVAEGSEQHGRRLRKPHCHGHQVGTGSTPRDYCGDRTVAQRLSAAARCKLECIQAQEHYPN